LRGLTRFSEDHYTEQLLYFYRKSLHLDREKPEDGPTSRSDVNNCLLARQKLSGLSCFVQKKRNLLAMREGTR